MQQTPAAKTSLSSHSKLYQKNDIPILSGILRAVGGALIQSPDHFKAMPMGSVKLVQGLREVEPSVEQPAPQSKGPQDATLPLQTKWKARPGEKELKIDFKSYLKTMKQLHIFQTTNDIAGYRGWLEKEKSPVIRLIVALRKHSRETGPSGSPAWQARYTGLARKENCSPAQVEELHRWMQYFDEMRAVLTRFIQAVRTQPRRIIQAMQFIWPEVMSILNGEWLAELMLSRLELPILKINDGQAGETIRHLLEPLFERAEVIVNKA